MWETLWNMMKAGFQYLLEMLFKWLEDSSSWLLGTIINSLPTDWQPDPSYFSTVGKYWVAMDYYVSAAYGFNCLVFYIQFYLAFLIVSYLVKLL